MFGALLNSPIGCDDLGGMLPLHALLSHAELTKTPPASPEQTDARTTPRRPRYGNLTLYPLVHRPEPVDPLTDEEPTLAASISNISRQGLGLISGDDLPAGTQFDVRWAMDGGIQLMRFVVVHSRPTLDGMFRTGARLLAGELPEEPAPMPLPESATPVLMQPPAPSEATVVEPIRLVGDADIAGSIGLADEAAAISEPELFIDPGVLHIEPSLPPALMPAHDVPAGTFQMSAASGFEKVERLDGVTTCGWERQIEMRRVGERLWLYIHSPGKKNGWGIFVDPDQFEAALTRVQESATSPFISSMAA